MKIYLASSWQNESYPRAIAALRSAIVASVES